MHLTVEVDYGGREVEEFVVPCGDGRKTFQWLSQAVAERFARSKPHGRRRQREPALRPSRYPGCVAPARPLPARVSTADTPSHDPKSLLCDELIDGQKVRVTLATSMPVDTAVGRPMMDDWATVAFCAPDGAQKQHREEAKHAEARLADRVNAERAAAAAARAASIARAKADQVRDLMAGQLLGRDKLEAAFADDWRKLDNPAFHPLDRLVPLAKDQAAVKEVICTNYLDLAELFKACASVGSGARSADILAMDYMEFHSFIHDCKAFHPQQARETIDKIFAECAAGSGSGGGSGGGRAAKSGGGSGGGALSGEMYKQHFFLALVLMACILYQVQVNGADYGYRPGLTPAAGVPVPPKEKADSAADALRRFIADYLLPVAEQRLAGTRVKRALETDVVLAAIFDYHEPVRAVFDRYCNAQATAAAAGGLPYDDVLTMNGFSSLLQDAKLIGSETETGVVLAFKDVRQAFAGAQDSLGGDQTPLKPQAAPNTAGITSSRALLDGGAAGGPEAAETMELMSFPEFLEGLARVSVMRWTEPALPADQKVRRGLAAVAELAGRGSKWE